MALILCIETSTNICSVALSENGQLLASLEEREANSHAALLTVLIERLMAQSSKTMSDLDAVAVSSGPGSYTGLRIGVSVAKGICYALHKPLIAIPSLQILAAGVALSENTHDSDTNTLICAMIDARRMEVYSALYDDKLTMVREIKAEIIDANSYAPELEKGAIVFAGNGSEKCKDVIQHHHALFLKGIHPLASQMSKLAFTAFEQEHFESVAYFEPFYLKDFVATIPKRKVF